MAEHESAHAKQPSSKSTSQAPAPKPKVSGESGSFCRILGGRPKGRGLAELTVSTKGHPEIVVGMKGVLMAATATFEITAVRPGVATVRLEGKGVEKMQYVGIAIVNPSASLANSNRGASELSPPTKAEAEATKERLLGGK